MESLSLPLVCCGRGRGRALAFGGCGRAVVVVVHWCVVVVSATMAELLAPWLSVVVVVVVPWLQAY